MTSRRIGWIAGALIALLLIYAWVDGGEEALHPISEPVAVPGAAQ